MQGPVHPRRIKVIDNVFQFRMIAILLTVVVGGLAAFVAGVLVVSAVARGISLPRLARMYAVLPPILVNDLVIMILLVVMGVFLTHRIAGPADRVQKDIERVLAGEKGVKVRFRKGDAFPELADKVNQLIERVDDKRQG